MNKKIKCLGITAAMLLATAPIAVPTVNNLAGETTVKASDNQDNTLDFKLDPDDVGPLNLGFYGYVDGVKTEGWTDLVYINKVGGAETQPVPKIDGYATNQSTISILRTSTGYRLLDVPTYFKDKGPDSSATTKINHEVITIKNKNGNYCPLFSFSSETGKASQITNRALGNNTKWYSDKTTFYDGSVYYRVATNEWVKDTYFLSAEKLNR